MNALGNSTDSAFSSMYQRRHWSASVSMELTRFSKSLEEAIHAALAQANARRHELATLEHLLLALIDEPDASRVLQACELP